MNSNEMMQKMATSCKVLNDVLRYSENYIEFRKKYQKLESDGKMHKMNDLYNLCEEFSR